MTMNNKILLFFCIAISLTAGNTLTAQIYGLLRSGVHPALWA